MSPTAIKLPSNILKLTNKQLKQLTSIPFTSINKPIIKKKRSESIIFETLTEYEQNKETSVIIMIEDKINQIDKINKKLEIPKLKFPIEEDLEQSRSKSPLKPLENIINSRRKPSTNNYVINYRSIDDGISKKEEKSTNPSTNLRINMNKISTNEYKSPKNKTESFHLIKSNNKNKYPKPYNENIANRIEVNEIPNSEELNKIFLIKEEAQDLNLKNKQIIRYHFLVFIRSIIINNESILKTISKIDNIFLLKNTLLLFSRYVNDIRSQIFEDTNRLNKSYKPDDQQKMEQSMNEILDEVQKQKSRHDYEDRWISNIRFPEISKNLLKKKLEVRMKNTKIAIKSHIKQLDQDIRSYVSDIES